MVKHAATSGCPPPEQPSPLNSLCAYNYEVRSWRARSGQKHQSLTRENQTIFPFGRSFLGLILTIPTSDSHFSKQRPPPPFACHRLLIADHFSKPMQRSLFLPYCCFSLLAHSKAEYL